MSLQRRWADLLGDEVLDPHRADAFFTQLCVATVILQHDALAFLAAQPLFARYLAQAHDAESVWRAVHRADFVDPSPDEWHDVVRNMATQTRAELSALRPYSHNAAQYYRQYCDARADAMDCNDLFCATHRADKTAYLASVPLHAVVAEQSATPVRALAA